MNLHYFASKNWLTFGYFLLGCVSTLGWAPFHWWPLTWCAGVLVLRADLWRYHAVFLFGFSLAGFHWLYHAFEVVGLGAWGIGAIVLLAFGLMILRLTVIVVCDRLWQRFVGRKHVLVLAAGYALSEWVQGHALTGLPWHLLSYTWSYPQCWQSVAWWGAEGLSAIMWLSFGLLAIRRWIGVTLFWLGLIGWGEYHLQHTPLKQGSFRLRLVNPGIAQSDKWQQSHFHDIIDRMSQLSKQGVGVDLVVWPEAAVPIWMTSDVAMWLWPHETPLATGAIRYDAQKKIYNSFCVLKKSVVRAVYDKRHLTPFGEYMPLHIPLSKLTHGTLDYSAGQQGAVLIVKGKCFWPIICFESIFGREMAPSTDKKLDGVILITNDGWFGQHVGPQQHAHIARFRAVEWGLPVVRVANNGITCVVDAEGRIVASMPFDRPGALEAVLPE